MQNLFYFLDLEIRSIVMKYDYANLLYTIFGGRLVGLVGAHPRKQSDIKNGATNGKRGLQGHLSPMNYGTNPLLLLK